MRGNWPPVQRTVDSLKWSAVSLTIPAINLHRHITWLLSAAVAISFNTPAAGSESRPVPMVEQAVEAKRQQIIQVNLRKFMNLKEDELTGILGTPDLSHRSETSKVLKYNLANEVTICFIVRQKAVDRFLLIQEPKQTFMPRFRTMIIPSGEPSFPEADRAIYESRWRIIQRNLGEFINMPREKLIQLLGRPNAGHVVGKDDIIYDLGKEVDILFTFEYGRISDCCFLRHPKRYFRNPFEPLEGAEHLD